MQRALKGFEMSKQKYTESALRRKTKADLFGLCLREFGLDTASIYRHYRKDEMISDLLTVRKADDKWQEPLSKAFGRCYTAKANPNQKTVSKQPVLRLQRVSQLISTDVAVSSETQSERKIDAFTAMLAASRLQFAVQTELESVRLLNF